MTLDQIKKGNELHQQITELNSAENRFIYELEIIKGKDRDTSLKFTHSDVILRNDFAVRFLSNSIEFIAKEIAKKEKELSDL